MPNIGDYTLGHSIYSSSFSATGAASRVSGSAFASPFFEIFEGDLQATNRGKSTPGLTI